VSQSSGPVASVKPLTSAGSIDGLVREVGNSVLTPVNSLQVAALLETAGVTETIAKREYGYDDIFSLAEAVQTALLELGVQLPPADTRLSGGMSASATPTVPPDDRKAMLVDYLRGPFSLLPLVLLSWMISVYQAYGQWSSGRVLILSGATIGSLLVTSGFVQVAARKGSIYLSQGFVLAARRFLARLMAVSLCVVVITAALLAAGGRWLGVLEASDTLLLVAAFVMLSMLWLLSGVLSLLGRVLWFGLGLAIGAVSSYGALLAMQAADLRVDLLVPGAAGIGFGTAAIVMGVVIVRALRAEHATTPPQRVVPPPRAHLAVALAPFFVYGIAYLLTVLSGHVGGWVGRLPEGLDRVEGIAASEMGLTLALMGYMLVGGVAEHTMQRFWRRVNVYQAQTSAVSPEGFAESIDGFYRRERLRFGLALLICSAGVAAAVAIAVSLSSGVFLGMAWTPSLTMVLFSGMAGYGLLAMGVFDTMLLITLSRPRFALEALAVGLSATLIVSFSAGKAISYAYGSLGTVAGGLAFLAMARRRLQHLVQRADYYFYSSF
jgi:hypothetical protein